MKLSLKLITISFLTLFFGLFFTRNVLATNYNLSGSVKDSTGAAITGATVTVNDTNSDHTTTDNSGNYTMSIPSGTYDVQVTPLSGSNYTSAIALAQNITSDTVLNFILVNSGSVKLSGHLYDPLGTPLSNQTISLTNTSTGATVASTTTDGGGNYSLQAAPATYGFFVTGTNSDLTLNTPRSFQIYTFSYTLSQSTILDITIPAKKVTVHVQDSTGTAINGVEVDAAGTGGSNVVNINGITLGGNITVNGISREVPGPVTDSSGNATLWLLPTDSNNWYNFTVTPPSGSSYLSTTLSNISITADTTQTVILQQPITLNGHVYDPLGNPISNQNIYLTDTSTGATVASATTDGSGSYSIQATSGTYGLFVSGTNNAYSLDIPKTYQLFTFSFTIAQNKTLDITLPFKRVSVHVQNPTDQGVNGVEIDAAIPGGGTVNIGGLLVGGISMSGTNSEVPGPQTDNSGNTTLWLIPNNLGGTYTFTATPPNGSAYNVYTLTNISVTSDQTELISLQYNHAAPLTTANLATQNLDGTYSNPTTVTLSATAASGYTVANTYYTVDGGAQQTYSSPFTVTGDGQHSITYWSVDNSGVQETPNTKSFTVETTYALSGTVYNDLNQNGVQDPGEQGVSNVSLNLNTGQQVTTDSNGNYTFSSLVPGTYTETMTVPSGYFVTTTNPATVAVNGNTTENFGIAVIPPTPTPTATPTPTPTNVPTPTPTPVPTYTISGTTFVDANQNGIQDPGEVGYANATITLSTGQTTTTDSNGNYSLPGLVAGTYTETLTVPSGYQTTTTNPVSVPVSTDTTVNFGIILIPPTPTPTPTATPTPTNTPTPTPTSTPTPTPTPTNVPPVVSAITAPTTPVEVNTSVAVSASFTDANTTDTHTASWNWGDGSSSTCPSNSASCTLTESNGSGTVTGSHAYTTAGIYSVTLTVTDNHSASGTSPTFNYIVVFDPSAGWVAGSKEFTSPAGAVVGNTSVTGTATFGFQAKYQNGSMVPSGKNVSLSFPTGNINFVSTGYEWLVVNNPKAVFLADGTLNGVSGYTILISSIDQGSTHQNGLLRIQIRDASQNVVYDTQPGAAGTVDPTTSVTKGQIAVH